MKTKVYLTIVFRLALIFSFGILISFITPELRDFFGDTLKPLGDKSQDFMGVDGLYNWGTRHYWYYWFFMLLFLLSIVDFIAVIIKVVKKNYDTSKW